MPPTEEVLTSIIPRCSNPESSQSVSYEVIKSCSGQTSDIHHQSPFIAPPSPYNDTHQERLLTAPSYLEPGVSRESGKEAVIPKTKPKLFVPPRVRSLPLSMKSNKEDDEQQDVKRVQNPRIGASPYRDTSAQASPVQEVMVSDLKCPAVKSRKGSPAKPEGNPSKSNQKLKQVLPSKTGRITKPCPPVRNNIIKTSHAVHGPNPRGSIPSTSVPKLFTTSSTNKPRESSTNKRVLAPKPIGGTTNTKPFSDRSNVPLKARPSSKSSSVPKPGTKVPSIVITKCVPSVREGIPQRSKKKNELPLISASSRQVTVTRQSSNNIPPAPVRSTKSVLPAQKLKKSTLSRSSSTSSVGNVSNKSSGVKTPRNTGTIPKYKQGTPRNTGTRPNDPKNIGTQPKDPRPLSKVSSW